MSFKDIEKKLKFFWSRSLTHPTDQSAQRIRQKTLAVFLREQKQAPTPFWSRMTPRWGALFSFLLIGGGLGSFIFQNNHTIAGKIEPQYGPVEIIRGDKSFLIQDPAPLHVGDVINVGSNSNAKLLLSQNFISNIENRSKVVITSPEAVFLEKGSLKNEVFKTAEVATDRGFIKSSPGGSFDISVSETGETKVSPTKNNIYVFDLQDGRLSLSAGEEIILRSDTRLADAKAIPEDLKLSNAQIASIYSKLAIARTKILTGAEKSVAGSARSARRDFTSAEKSFLSIAQVLKTSRELEISRRKNLDNIALDQIAIQVAAKADDAKLLAEIVAVENLFNILRENRGNLAFAPQNSGVESYDRYVTLSHILALGSQQQQDYGQLLKEKYVVNFLRTVQNQELKIEQIANLNDAVDKLPRTELAKNFLNQAQERFSPDLQVILGEKTEAYF